MPARNNETESSRRSGPRKVWSRLRFQWGARLLTNSCVNQRARRESSLENAANAKASNTMPIQRHNGVPISCQFTKGRGRCRSMTELWAI